MLKLNALELLKKRGKTKYWLYKQMGMSYQNFTRMINNQTKSIKYDNLEAMCYIFLNVGSMSCSSLPMMNLKIKVKLRNNYDDSVCLS